MERAVGRVGPSHAWLILHAWLAQNLVQAVPEREERVEPVSPELREENL